MKFGLIMGTQGDYLEWRALCLVLVEWPHVEQRLINYLFFGLVFGLGGVGHCFAWHVRVSLVFYINF